ncbi:hypothetical protein psal_cds_420 [Pandoravirus salinus]|uniref:Uncharacterized protein n=1 Tax=Pandoravirus salinus TaxID=1349410 RepID=S4VUV6_9VIRU|nr:hypothetical protein psal_cds_420 [Pandoravirus salinus]AGO84143.1 hypothetical protein psal_cds_420 [Pandoravirus salinus]
MSVPARRQQARVPRTYLVPITKRIRAPGVVLAALDRRDNGASARDDDDGDDQHTTTVTTFARLTKAQMAKGRMRAWTERRARQKALAHPVPASQSCPRCKACVRAGPDACPSCAAPLVAVVSDAIYRLPP